NYKKVSVKIYDRTGRLLKTLTGENLTWDGKLNGVYMPKNDYWFTVEMIGLNDKSMSIVGHFSLLR
ncbi:MAG: T9SS type B sorting domain-containing protein, partial [Flavobacteriaceae bacterium]|nr:T9SS type B sorting domain-containing protein [Flavobacteriaceae bacterium]